MDKYLILIALGILIPGLLFVALHWPQGIYKTFSQHIALKRVSIIYYFALFALVLPILFVFFKNYLVPELHLADVALLLVALSSVAQIACTLVPEVGGTKTIVHQIFAGISALLLLVVLLFIVRSDTISALDRVVVTICIAAMLLIVGFVAFWKRTRIPSLLLQVGYFALFFIAILFVTY